MNSYRDANGVIHVGAITCEAKQHRERILENQIVEQAKAACQTGQFERVIPIGLRAVQNRGIYVAEFAAVQPANAATYQQPVLIAEALYELKPPIQGI
jgi:hypothetical protein